MAEFEFKCPKCKQFIVAEESYRGQVAQCPYCGRNIAIPEKQSAIGKKDPVEKTGFWRGIRRKYFSSKGRLTRDEFRSYLGVTCLFYMIWIILCAIAALLSKSGCVSLARVVAPIVMVIAMVIMLIVLCANCSLLFVMIRRLQDINRSQWWLLALIVGMQYCRLSGIDWSGGSLYVGGIVLGAWILVLTIFDGTPGRNDYGDDPKGRSSKGNYKDKSKLIITTLSACSIIIPVIATFIILQKSHNVSSLDQVNQSVQEMPCNNDDMIVVNGVKLKQFKGADFQKVEDEDGDIVFCSVLPEEACFTPSIRIYNFEEENLKDVLPFTRTTTIFQQKFIEATIENIKNELKETECDMKILKRTENTLTALLSFETHYAYQKYIVDFRRGRCILVTSCYKSSRDGEIMNVCVDSATLSE